ncbi:MAG: hypothetical protein E5W70_31920 [Mesorhizobium sp.]|nr:MAG: hypothetical protein E5W70_31920 [Mesorhizobium sp.]
MNRAPSRKAAPVSALDVAWRDDVTMHNGSSVKNASFTMQPALASTRTAPTLPISMASPTRKVVEYMLIIRPTDNDRETAHASRLTTSHGGGNCPTALNNCYLFRRSISDHRQWKWWVSATQK